MSIMDCTCSTTPQEKYINKIRMICVFVCKNGFKIGRDDPRRVVHSLKVGIALTLVSFLYIFEPFFEGLGQNAMWAIMTVVVVMEFTAGATLCKGLNRGLGTLCAGSLAFLIEAIGDISGKTFRAFFVGSSVFIVGFLATYLRFFPEIKKNYDYGMMIFLLTFNLITVSSLREEDVVPLARDRLCTIAIGCGICLFMTLIIVPIWSGEDLHNSTVCKLEGLASSIEACVNLYFHEQAKEENNVDVKSTKELISNGYRAVLDSKSSDETLATFASWEPRHSRHCYKYPWKQYVKLGSILRHFGYSAISLHGCLESEIQTSSSVKSEFRDPCIRVSNEIAKILRDLASSMRAHRHCSPDILSDHLHQALHDLNSSIRSQARLFLCSTEFPAKLVVDSDNTETRAANQPVLSPSLSNIGLEFSEALPFAGFASLLVEMAARLELVIQGVEELSQTACFKDFNLEEHYVSFEAKDNERKENPKFENLHTREISHGVV